MYREALKWLMMSHTPTLSHQVYIYPPTILHTVGAPGSLSTRRHFHFKDSHTKLVAIWYVRLFHQGSPFGEQVGRRCKSNRKLEPLCPLSAFFFFFFCVQIQSSSACHSCLECRQICGRVVTWPAGGCYRWPSERQIALAAPIKRAVSHTHTYRSGSRASPKRLLGEEFHTIKSGMGFLLSNLYSVSLWGGAEFYGLSIYSR